jgi:hypothetical protein
MSDFSKGFFVGAGVLVALIAFSFAARLVRA